MKKAALNVQSAEPLAMSDAPPALSSYASQAKSTRVGDVRLAPGRLRANKR